ncbi:hypothetical protein O1611_g134 [Lasiodiplodia mahajangana]|uniref:Uncharacterized protein n=1 Tax=Lasiodiplodia mahajangana TaxID=1108764 RepID=A0ACC2K1V6_9PEZI|nr:hypothetical protein O1611_g134 [Lasiodiplodia mahajangana]
MNASRGNDATPCIDPAEIMYDTAARSNPAMNRTYVDSTIPYPRSVLLSNAAEQLNTAKDTDTNNQPGVEDSTEVGGSSAAPKVIRRKLFFLVAAHKTVQTGKDFVAVARIPCDKAENDETAFVNVQAIAYHYVPEVKHQQFNTSMPLTARELAGAARNDQAFAVHKTMGSSCAPAGIYLVYRLKRTDPGTRNLRFEATWDSANGTTGKASYDFIALKAEDDYSMKKYTQVQKKLLGELWPEWKKYIECD